MAEHVRSFFTVLVICVAFFLSWDRLCDTIDLKTVNEQQEVVAGNCVKVK